MKAQVVDRDLVLTIGLYVLYNALFVLVSIPAGQLSDKLGRKPVILVAFGLFALTCLIMASASSLALLSVGFALFGVYKGASEGVLKAYVTDIVPSDLRGTALGTFHTAVGLVMLPGGLIAGLLWDQSGSGATFLYGAVMAFAAMVLFSVFGKSNSHKLKQQA